MKYRKRQLTYRGLAEKLGCKVYKEGVGFVVWAKLPDGVTSAGVY
jgi:DNA-binding transcriptional MocR family regulator